MNPTTADIALWLTGDKDFTNARSSSSEEDALRASLLAHEAVVSLMVDSLVDVVESLAAADNRLE